MDAGNFDSLAKVLAIPGPRRRLLELLAVVPVLGGLLGVLSADAATERQSESAGAAQRRHSKGRGKHKRKGKKCKPEPAARTCAGRCGSFINNCGKPVNCTACLCNPACATCFTCEEAPNVAGVCVVDPVQQGKSCGGNGKVCQPDGSCACVPTTCAAEGATCGTISNGCGGHLTCGVCTGSSQVCVDNICAACDVCASGCDFTSVQAAIDATTPQLTTIRVCPGTYFENAEPLNAVHITRTLRLVGAGDGQGDAGNTILRPDHTNQRVVFVETASSVVLQGLRMTGATGDNGVGLVALQSSAELKTCTISGNIAGSGSGGIGLAGPATRVTLTDTRVTGNTGKTAGGIDVQGPGSQLTLDTLSRVTGNTATSAFGGIRAFPDTSVTLPSADNVTNNTNFGALKNCGGDGSFTGPGAVCTTI